MKRTQNGNKFPDFCNKCSQPWLLTNKTASIFMIIVIIIAIVAIIFTLMTMAPPFMSQGRD